MIASNGGKLSVVEHAQVLQEKADVKATLKQGRKVREGKGDEEYKRKKTQVLQKGRRKMVRKRTR